MATSTSTLRSRYGDCTLPMDETLVTAAVELSGRPFFGWRVEVPNELLGAAQKYPAIASRFANGFDNPPDFTGWFMDPGQAARYLADTSTARSAG